MAAALRAAGVSFVGPTTAYALMQAVGLVDDHLEGCFVPPRRATGGQQLDQSRASNSSSFA